jgi:hypothetical protein
MTRSIVSWTRVVASIAHVAEERWNLTTLPPFSGLLIIQAIMRNDVFLKHVWHGHSPMRKCVSSGAASYRCAPSQWESTMHDRVLIPGPLFFCIRNFHLLTASRISHLRPTQLSPRAITATVPRWRLLPIFNPASPGMEITLVRRFLNYRLVTW